MNPRLLGPRLDRTQGHAEVLGGLGQGQAEVVMEDEDRALFCRQAPEAPLELVALDDRDGGIRLRRPVGRQNADVRRPAATASQLGVTGVDEQPMEPRVKTVGITERPQLTPRRHEGQLDGILRQPEVAQDAIRDREESIASATCQAGKRLLVPVPRRVDERSLHSLRPPDQRPRWAFAAYESRTVPVGSIFVLRCLDSS